MNSLNVDAIFRHKLDELARIILIVLFDNSC